MNIVFYQAALSDAQFDRSSGESEQVRLQSIPPIVGEVVSMGAERLWTVTDIDVYENSQGMVFLAHVALDVAEIGDRSNWYFVQSFKKRPATNLQIFVSEQGQYLHIAESMVGKVPQPGHVLPDFNVENHTVGHQPWGVTKVNTFLPKETGKELCFAAIHVAHCVYIPELAVA